MSLIRTCPRCNERAFEKLATHSHCLCCNYTPDLLNFRDSRKVDDAPIPQWALDAIAKPSAKKRATVISMPAKLKVTPIEEMPEGNAAS